MEMLLYGRRLSFTRLAIMLLSMSLMLYLFYDFMSFQSQPERGVNYLDGERLRKLQKMKDKLRSSDVRADVQGDRYDPERYSTKQSDDDTERAHVHDDADDDSDEDFTKDGNSENILEEKINDQTRNEVINNDIDKKEAKSIDINNDDDDDDDVGDDFNDDDDDENDDDDDENDDDDDDFDDDDDDDDDNYKGEEADKNEEKTKKTETLVDKSTKKKLNAFRQALEYEEHLRETNTTFTRIIHKAKYISVVAPTPNFLLVNFVCKSCLPFVNSWLCNTKYINLHKSVLFVARDLSVRRSLLNDWPDLNVVALQPSLSKGDYSDIRKSKNACVLKKLQLINGLLRAGINLLVFDAKSVWFENPVPNLTPSLQPDVDIIVNIIPNSHLNTGFLVLFATKKTELFWRDLYGDLRNDYINGKESKKRKEINLEDRYEEYLQTMIKYRHHGVTVRQLPVNLFTDGVWYLLKEEERSKTRPVVIRNNYVEGNGAKIQRARRWNHWFLLDDNTCNMNLVRKIGHL